MSRFEKLKTDNTDLLNRLSGLTEASHRAAALEREKQMMELELSEARGNVEIFGSRIKTLEEENSYLKSRENEVPPAMTSSRPMTASRPASVVAVQNEELEVVSRQLAQVR